jgi:hypothetical protein
MPEYEQVVVAGNQAGVNAFRAAFDTADQSDLPQLQAWDDEQVNAATIEALAGTTENGDKSFLCAASTDDGNADPGAAWATGLAQTAGSAVVNRLKGNDAFVTLGTTIPTSPFPKYRRFQFAFAVTSDAQVGTVGHQPYLAIKVFYTGAAPTVDVEYNAGTEGAPNWKPMVLTLAGVSNPIGVGTTIHATGPATTGGVGSNNGVLDAVTKPGSGEKFAEEYWVRSL